MPGFLKIQYNTNGLLKNRIINADSIELIEPFNAPGSRYCRETQSRLYMKDGTLYDLSLTMSDIHKLLQESGSIVAEFKAPQVERQLKPVPTASPAAHAYGRSGILQREEAALRGEAVTPPRASTQASAQIPAQASPQAAAQPRPAAARPAIRPAIRPVPASQDAARKPTELRKPIDAAARTSVARTAIKPAVAKASAQKAPLPIIHSPAQALRRLSENAFIKPIENVRRSLESLRKPAEAGH